MRPLGISYTVPGQGKTWTINSDLQDPKYFPKKPFLWVGEKRQDQGTTSWASVEVATTLSTRTAASVSLLLAISTSKDFLTENSVVLGVPFAICQFTFVSISCNLLVGWLFGSFVATGTLGFRFVFSDELFDEDICDWCAVLPPESGCSNDMICKITQLLSGLKSVNGVIGCRYGIMSVQGKFVINDCRGALKQLEAK